MRLTKFLWSGLAIGVVVVAALAPVRGSADAKADDPNPGVYQLTEKIGDKTYAEWAVAWWQWGIGTPKDKNPIADKTGEHAGVGQSGPVWFLAGTFGGKGERKCSVPAGKALFFPVVNQASGSHPDRFDEKKSTAFAKEVMDSAEDLEVTVDGKALKDVNKYRVQTPVFHLDGPEKEEDGVNPGAAGPHKMISDGYWIMLKPLPAGEHVVHFKGKVKKVGFNVDVTYKLTILEEKKP
jgi:hypothetical protein